jgi:hypothetical protein
MSVVYDAWDQVHEDGMVMPAVYDAVISLNHELLLSVLAEGHFVDEPWGKWTPLYALVMTYKWHDNIPKILHTLLKNGADANIECQERLSYRCDTKFFSTPLLELVVRFYRQNEGSRVQMISWLIRHGADVNYVDTRGQSILCWAAGGLDRVYVVQLLINSGVSSSLDDALHTAAFEGNVKVARYLVEMGASTTRRNRNGYTAVDFARMCSQLCSKNSRNAFADGLNNIAEVRRLDILNSLAIAYDREKGRGSRFSNMDEDPMRMIMDYL